MTKDEIWNKLKNDKTIIYGEPIFDVFLRTLENIKKAHFFELDKKQLNLLNKGAMVKLVVDATWTHNVDFLNSLLEKNINVEFTPIELYFVFMDALGKYDARTFKLLLKIIDKQIENLRSKDVYLVLTKMLNEDPSLDVVGILGQINLDKLSDIQVIGLVEGYEDKKRICEILKNNIKKLKGKELYELFKNIDFFDYYAFLFDKIDLFTGIKGNNPKQVSTRSYITELVTKYIRLLTYYKEEQYKLDELLKKIGTSINFLSPNDVFNLLKYPTDHIQGGGEWHKEHTNLIRKVAKFLEKNYDKKDDPIVQKAMNIYLVGEND
jgi:hypothetical protein